MRENAAEDMNAHRQRQQQRQQPTSRSMMMGMHLPPSMVGAHPTGVTLASNRNSYCWLVTGQQPSVI